MSDGGFVRLVSVSIYWVSDFGGGGYAYRIILEGIPPIEGPLSSLTERRRTSDNNPPRVLRDELNALGNAHTETFPRDGWKVTRDGWTYTY